MLGDANPFVGDYGISTNPESFAKESYRAYFTDRQRGAVLRLSMDGVTPISDAGMHAYFRDNLKASQKLIGTYDAHKQDYNLTLIDFLPENVIINNLSIGDSTTDTWTNTSNFVLDGGLGSGANVVTPSVPSNFANNSDMDRNVTIRNFPQIFKGEIRSQGSYSAPVNPGYTVSSSNIYSATVFNPAGAHLDPFSNAVGSPAVEWEHDGSAVYATSSIALLDNQTNAAIIMASNLPAGNCGPKTNIPIYHGEEVYVRFYVGKGGGTPVVELWDGNSIIPNSKLANSGWTTTHNGVSF